MEHQGITPLLVVAMETEESRHGSPKVLLFVERDIEWLSHP